MLELLGATKRKWDLRGTRRSPVSLMVISVRTTSVARSPHSAGLGIRDILIVTSIAMLAESTAEFDFLSMVRVSWARFVAFKPDPHVSESSRCLNLEFVFRYLLVIHRRLGMQSRAVGCICVLRMPSSPRR